MRLFMTIGLVLLLGTQGIPHELNDKEECARIKENIRHIQSMMRSGYTRAQGERMEARLRKLRAKRKSKCR